MDAKAAAAPTSLPGVRRRPPDVVDMADVAAICGVDRNTPKIWRKRPSAQMPPELATINGGPVWWRETIVEWAKLTGRLVDEHAKAEA